MKTNRREKVVRRRVIFASVILLLLVLPTVALADTGKVTITVINDRGQVQPSVLVYSSSGDALYTGPQGTVTTWATSGETITSTRQSSAPPCGAPEGDGSAYAVTVPDPVPANLTITLPSIPYESASPELSQAESGFLGKLNEIRASLGRQPLTHYRILAEAASNYARHLNATRTFNDWHCSLFGPGARIKDRGWPANGWAETAVYARGMRQALAWWQQSEPHWQALTQGSFDAIGIGQVGDVAIANLSRCPIVELCGLSEGQGNVSWFGIDDPPPYQPDRKGTTGNGETNWIVPDAGTREAPGLSKLRAKRLRKGRVRLSWRIKRRAEGITRACVVRSKRRRCSSAPKTMKRQGRYQIESVTLRLPRGRGRVEISVTFRGHSWWRSARVSRTIKLASRG